MNKFFFPTVKYPIPFLLLLILGFQSPALAQIGNNEVFGFLQIPADARSAALGGNHVSLDQGGVSLFTTNPAYLTEVSHKELSVSYLNHFSDIYLASAGFAYHLGNIGTFASGIRFVNYGDFTRTDSDGREHGSFSSYDFSWSGAISRPLLDRLQAGFGTQLIVSSYDSYQSTAIAFFGGLYYSFNSNYTHAALSFRHLGAQLTPFDDTREDLPFTITAGITHRLQHLPLRFNLALHSLNRWEMPVFDDEDDPGFTSNLFRHMRMGVELLFSENVNLRIGYDHLRNQELKSDQRIDLSGAGIGLGIGYRDFRFDISRSSYSETGGLIQLSLSHHF
ncbi:type IX secretion system protein PorQ [Balneolales bacterium ANBcel1]|nr:type IX secretion system protein PorQ [Balneolales bacterium ANBcel1]